MARDSELYLNSEEGLIRGIHNKDRRTFTHVYELHFQGLVLAADRYVKDPGIAKELVQDIFIRIWEQPALLNENGSLRAYLYKAVINHSLNYIKREKNIARHHNLIAESLTDSYLETLQEEQELKVEIYRAVEQLPAQCRKVFKMSRFDGLKYREIAADLKISEKTVENHIVHALKLLRETLLQNPERPRSPSATLRIMSWLFF
ncbi:RNA polymerase sigma-70 factor [Chitinophaga pendula]|nr:RNA polymerase sigma-70 factor [Chitinophaga pendula]UCJ08974.1 RNA polymerase sigma-70 factor [Chitinophaga pendula]